MLLTHIGRSLATSPSLFLSLSSSSRYHRRAAMAVNFSGGGGGRATLRGVVFDMDGTLTVPVIDFAAMYRAVLGDEGLAAARAASPSGSVDVLHHIEKWAPPEQQKAYEIITHFERQGLDRLQIMPGATELCEYLDSKKIRRGLITRNIKAAVDLFHQRFGMKFIPALSREFRPYKPDPAPLLHICSTWGIPPSEVMMIGDSPRDDGVLLTQRCRIWWEMDFQFRPVAAPTSYLIVQQTLSKRHVTELNAACLWISSEDRMRPTILYRMDDLILCFQNHNQGLQLRITMPSRDRDGISAPSLSIHSGLYFIN
ncbi:haloacid dehalogenase-like hydrolase domain-containing protein At2g33255 isoform X2 [Elaeis guineensis]|uniref:haloacid dehalogenase-like hydrolase domain-containing protein At2g33255 isoform X2 n=1 Tax=Elaeis guineensis var. tenera TaxID=51953 RepID=UPI003C6D014F